MQLSPHFTLAEFTRSAVAARRGIDNTVPAALVPNLKRLATAVLEPVRAQFKLPFSPTSGYRCPALNRAVGSRDDSQHVKGEAVDFRLPGLSNLAVARWVRDHLDYDQLILEYWQPGEAASGWVHVSVSDANRREVLTLGPPGRVMRGLPLQ